MIGILTTTIALAISFVDALPSLYSESEICRNGGDLCTKDDMKYELILPAQPGFQYVDIDLGVTTILFFSSLLISHCGAPPITDAHPFSPLSFLFHTRWDDAGGYCGSWAIQRATLTKGAWISQQQVRDHTVPGGGHDNEILSTNIVTAFKNLHIDVEGFDYNQPVPQQQAYATWLKKQLTSGYAVTWMILWSGQAYPIYGLKAPAGMYGHVEPVIGIQSNHPLNDTTVYDDDVAVHFTDGGTNKVYRKISSIGGKLVAGEIANCAPYSYCMAKYAFGWAVKGFVDPTQHIVAMPASLHIDPWKSEPDIRAGQHGVPLKGTLTVSALTSGKTYDLYRWDVDTFGTYTTEYHKLSFTATNNTYVYVDDQSFMSNGTTYYKCVEHQAQVAEERK